MGRRSCRGRRRAASRGGADVLPTALLLSLAWVGTACSPIVREPDFVGARDQVTDASLLGPFDGQVVDETTAEPVQGATVIGIWSYDQGDGLIGPAGSEVLEVTTDAAGRYRIPRAPLDKRGRSLRLVSFELVIYKRGYVGYRSDTTFEGRPRTDFTVRHNRVQLRKWRESDSHARHLLFLQPPPRIARLARWERARANLDLYREQSGIEVAPVEPGPTQVEPTMQLLDASEVLPPGEVRRRTGFTDAFSVKELGDLAHTHFYHGVHLQAVDREETWDVAYRVWKDPPGGLGPVQETFEATLPGVEPTPEITDETWVFDSEDVRAVAFLDRERNAGVLLTCGSQQCIDIETAIILAKYIHDHLDRIELVDAPSETAPPSPAQAEGKDEEETP